MITVVLEGSLVKVVWWYENEWGYSNCRFQPAKQVLVNAHA
jgi:glyceraldehyde-3-phosphate dehydrogenase/erythrose-4-phosphate dehydrogenase